MVGVAFVAILCTVLFLSINSAYAQTTENQVTISEDLQNNPVAQDILKKIEKSKQWIENIQKRDFENQERQKELEEKRLEVLRHLKEDLKKWEELWEYYTFDSMLERALKDHHAKSTDTIYDHPLKFTASKIDAGRDALHRVIMEGGSPKEARDAFVEAAKMTRSEMISANILYNVLNGNAYYNQQILFEPDGNFDLEISGEQLREYYQDYRTNPGYLEANPLDKRPWEELGKNNPSTECRAGYQLVYRIHADDYVCTTEYTAEMWVRHKMGSIVDENFPEKKIVDIKKLEQDRIAEKVKNLNLKIQDIQRHFEKKIFDTKQEYELFSAEIKDKKKEEEKQAMKKLSTIDNNKKEIGREIAKIREKYLTLEENIIDEKSRVMQILEEQYLKDIENFVRIHEEDSEIKIVWNSELPEYKAASIL